MIIHFIDMKKLGLHVILALAIATAGCNKFLEKEPDNRAKLNSPEKVAQLLGTAYPRGSYLPFTECISDNVNERASGSTSNTTMDPYNFRDVRSNDQDSPEFYWNSCYEAIAAANQALKAIREVPAAERAQYAPMRGEALVCRAYAHFMLVNIFSKIYNEATYATDPGIPYVTEPENVVIKPYERGTVKSVYEKIEKDLLAGIGLLKDESYKIPKYHFNRAAAAAFAARFYLFQKKYNNVLSYTDQIVDANVATKLRPWNTAYNAMTRLELYSVYQKATEPANLLLAETISSWPRDVYGARHSFDLTLTDLIRNEPLTGAQWAFIYQAYGNDFVYMPKINEYFVRESVNADFGTIYFMSSLFTMEEALFNRAEAMTYTGNLAGAIDLLNKYLSTRLYQYDPATDLLTETLINNRVIGNNMAEKVRILLLQYKWSEFIHEGMRWFDILRNNLTVEHRFVNGPTKRLAPGDKMRVFQIPQSAELSGVALNPR